MEAEGEIIFEGGKPYVRLDNRERSRILIPAHVGITREDENAFAEIIYEGQGRDMTLIEIKYETVDGEQRTVVIEAGQRNQRQAAPQNQQQIERERRERKPAVAPYNFVPLNEMPVESEELPFVVEGENGQKIYQLFDRYNLDEIFKNNGFIELKIETLTPVFIRGVGNKNLHIKNLPILPGSSIRGMIKNLVEICSYSKFKDNEEFEDKRFFQRGLADQSTLKDYYNSYMGAFGADVKGGYLIKQNNNFFIRQSLNSGTVNKTGTHISKTEISYTTGSGAVFYSQFHNKRTDWKIDEPDTSINLKSLSKDDIDYYLNDYELAYSSRKPSDKKDIPNITKLIKDKTKYPNGVPVLFI